MGIAFLPSISEVSRFFPNTDQLLEGTFWTGWCALSVKNWTDAKREKEIIEKDHTAKPQEIWNANKKYALSSLSLLSGVSMITTCLQEAGVIVLTSALSAIISSLGFGGSGIVSMFHAWDHLQEFGQGMTLFSQASGLQEKTIATLQQIETLLKIAFFITIASWCIFGSFHALFEGEVLFYIMDTSLYYGVVLFFSSIVSSILLSFLKMGKKDLTSMVSNK